MLLAYIDELGEPGAFVSQNHERFKTSPAFGYAGFIIPEAHARRFGGEFASEKRRLFKTELAKAPNPGRWEAKGSDMFRPKTPDTYLQYIRVFNGLVRRVRAMGGALFYYADEKPIGTPKQTNLDTTERERLAMQETLNRLCRHAETTNRGENLMVMIDQINETDRAKRLPNMYGHILSRAAERQEMQRIIEPPMHVDSVLSSNIQFADWVAAAITRAIDYQLIRDTKYSWVPDHFNGLRGSFTLESKLHLWHRGLDDFHHSRILDRVRPVHPAGTPLGIQFPRLVQVHEAAVRARERNVRQ
jgi:hypothetical protein